MPWFKNVGGRYVEQPTQTSGVPLGSREGLQMLGRAFDTWRSPPISRAAKVAFAKAAAAKLRERRRRAWRPPVAHDRPRSTPRPREGGARVVVIASGRDGSNRRDDGSGGDSGDGDGGGSGDGPPSRLGARVLERERARATS